MNILKLCVYLHTSLIPPRSDMICDQHLLDQFGFQVLFVRPFFMDPVAICRSWAGPIGIDLWLCLKIECVQFHRTAISKTHPFWWNWKHYHLWSSISIFDNSINSILSSLTIKFWRESPIFRQTHMIVCRHRCSACTQARVQIRGSTKKRKKEPFTYIWKKMERWINSYQCHIQIVPRCSNFCFCWRNRPSFPKRESQGVSPIPSVKTPSLLFWSSTTVTQKTSPHLPKGLANMEIGLPASWCLQSISKNFFCTMIWVCFTIPEGRSKPFPIWYGQIELDASVSWRRTHRPSGWKRFSPASDSPHLPSLMIDENWGVNENWVAQHPMASHHFAPLKMATTAAIPIFKPKWI